MSFTQAFVLLSQGGLIRYAPCQFGTGFVIHFDVHSPEVQSSIPLGSPLSVSTTSSVSSFLINWPPTCASFSIFLGLGMSACTFISPYFLEAWSNSRFSHPPVAIFRSDNRRVQGMPLVTQFGLRFSSQASLISPLAPSVTANGSLLRTANRSTWAVLYPMNDASFTRVWCV